MKLSTLTTAALIAAIASTNAYASALCETRTTDVPDIVIPGETVDVFGNVALPTSGPENHKSPGARQARCETKLTAYDRNFGFCQAAVYSVQTLASIGQGGGSKIVNIGKETLPDEIIETPDLDEWRVGVYVTHPITKVTKWAGTGWKDGSCPGGL